MILGILPVLLGVTQLTYQLDAPYRLAALVIALLPAATWAAAMATGPNSLLAWFFRPPNIVEMGAMGLALEAHGTITRVPWTDVESVDKTVRGPVLVGPGGRDARRQLVTWGARLRWPDGSGEGTLAMAIVAYRPDRYILDVDPSRARMRRPGDSPARVEPFEPQSQRLSRTQLLIVVVIVVATVLARLVGI